jgi:hypothetical protein
MLRNWFSCPEVGVVSERGAPEGVDKLECRVFKALASIIAVLYTLPALCFVYLDRRVGPQQLLAVVHLSICVAVVLAHVTRRAWLYWPFKLYSVLTVAS